MQICFKQCGPNLVITNVHVPSAWNHEFEYREDFFEALTLECANRKDKTIHLCIGDFNTRLHARKEGEEDIIGPHIFGRGKEFLDRIYNTAEENRTLLVNLLKATNHTIIRYNIKYYSAYLRQIQVP